MSTQFDIQTILQQDYDNAIRAGKKESAKDILRRAYNLGVCLQLDNVPRSEVGDLFMFDCM